MLNRLHDKSRQMTRVECVASSYKRVARADGQRQWVHTVLNRRFRHRLRLQSLAKRRRALPLSQTVHAVVEDDVSEVEVSTARVDEVAGANPITIAITAHGHYGHVVVRDLHARGGRKNASVQGVIAVCVDVVWRLARASDA